MSKVGIIRYPGSNCDIETFHYFNDLFGNNSSFYIWHNTNDLSVLNKGKFISFTRRICFWR